MKKKCKPKYNQGGELLGQVVPQALSLGLNVAAPGLGSIIAPIVGGLITKGQEKNNALQLLNDHYNSTKIGTNPYGYMKNGGQLQGSYSVPEFQGANHSQGGINVSDMGIPSTNPVAEVEDGETKYTIKGKTFIFSNKLRV